MLLSSDSCLLQRSLVHVSTLVRPYQERGQTLIIKKLVSLGHRQSCRRPTMLDISPAIVYLRKEASKYESDLGLFVFFLHSSHVHNTNAWVPGNNFSCIKFIGVCTTPSSLCKEWSQCLHSEWMVLGFLLSSSDRVLTAAGISSWLSPMLYRLHGWGCVP